ncbi:MAG: hypothetical protein ACJ749_19855 [Flavisolibacter sp.]
MSTNEQRNDSSNIPGNDSSKPMDSKREVEQSNDAKTDQDFPGYPHYPAKEDIMDQRTGSHRVDANLENMGTGPNASGVNQRFMEGQERERAESAMIPQPGNGRDDMQNDLAALDSTNEEIGTPQNVSNEDLDTELDVPGSDLDDKNEAIGEEDEENNYYSLGDNRDEGDSQ